MFSAICGDPGERGEGRRGAVEAFLGKGSAPIVDGVGGHACRRLLRPEAVPVVRRAEGGAADGSQAVFQVEGKYGSVYFVKFCLTLLYIGYGCGGSQLNTSKSITLQFLQRSDGPSVAKFA